MPPRLQSWSLRARARKCSLTGHAFQDGEPFHTALFYDSQSCSYQRQDFSIHGWQQRPADSPEPFSHWLSTFQQKSANKPTLSKDSAEEILDRWIREKDPETAEARYILALMLERQKVLVETDQRRTEQGTLRVYQNLESEDIYLIHDPELPLDEVLPLQSRVFTLLQQKGIQIG